MAYRYYLPVFLLWILSCGSVQAIVMSHSGEVNLTIGNDFDGLYLNFTDFGDATVYTTATSEPASWDINPFFGGAAVATSDTFVPVLSSTTTNSDLLNLTFGTTVGPSSDFPSGFSGSTGHMDDGVGPVDPVKFENGTSGYIGFALVDGSDEYYGWMEVTFNDDSSTGTIHEWAWNTVANEAITVGAVPEPSNAALLLGLAATGYVVRRRRRIAWLGFDIPPDVSPPAMSLSNRSNISNRLSDSR